ncbi:MAG: hypothetical protein IKO77_01125 [Bacteroidales bacterium]|nr:hypothetical protein [Bacteroidales bacterium]
MKRTEILDTLKEIFAQIRPSVDLEIIGEDSQLVRDLGMDSLTVLLLSLAVENKFGFKFEGAPQFLTVKEVIDYIENACQ